MVWIEKEGGIKIEETGRRERLFIVFFFSGEGGKGCCSDHFLLIVLLSI